LDRSVLLLAVLRADTSGKGRPRDEKKTQQWAEIISLLLEAGANPNREYKDIDGCADWQPLAVAVAHDLKSVVELLLQHRADVNHVNHNNHYNLGITALEVAARDGNVAMMKLLVKAGANVNLGDYKPMHLAARGGYIEAMEYLLSCKADPNAMNEHGQTPLGYAEELYNARFPGEDQARQLKKTMEFLRSNGGR